MITPDLTPKIKPYLTIIQHRSPVQKMHTTIGHAKNAFAYSSDKEGTLWEFVDGEWKLLYTVTAEGYGFQRKQRLPWKDEEPKKFIYDLKGTTKASRSVEAVSEEAARRLARLHDPSFIIENVEKRE